MTEERNRMEELYPKEDPTYIIPDAKLLKVVFYKLWSALRDSMAEYQTPDYSDSGYDDIEALISQTDELMTIDYEGDLEGFEEWINRTFVSASVLGAIKDCDPRLQARWDA